MKYKVTLYEKCWKNNTNIDTGFALFVNCFNAFYVLGGITHHLNSNFVLWRIFILNCRAVVEQAPSFYIDGFRSVKLLVGHGGRTKSSNEIMGLSCTANFGPWLLAQGCKWDIH